MCGFCRRQDGYWSCIVFLGLQFDKQLAHNKSDKARTWIITCLQWTFFCLLLNEKNIVQIRFWMPKMIDSRDLTSFTTRLKNWYLYFVLVLDQCLPGATPSSIWNYNVDAVLFNSVNVLLLLCALSKGIQDWLSNVLLMSLDSCNKEDEEKNKTSRLCQCSSGDSTSQKGQWVTEERFYDTVCVRCRDGWGHTRLDCHPSFWAFF